MEVSVADETGEALFVCIDGVMTKLHNMRAYEAGHLLVSLLSTVVHLFCAFNLFIQLQPLLTQAGDGVNPEKTQAPPFVTDMELWKVISTHSR